MNSQDPNDEPESVPTKHILQSRLYGKIELDFLNKGPEHNCPYLPEKLAREEAFHIELLPPDLYLDFMDLGFRRSGRLIYRPCCRFCSECIPLRVPTLTFKSSKSQRRVLNKNRDVTVSGGYPKHSDEKNNIFERYLSFQHNRANNDPDELRNFLYVTPLQTMELEYRIKNKLVAVSIVDLCPKSLSSVYTYFDPEFAHRSLGTFTALKEIQLCRSGAIPFYYLGYYVKDCPSMRYKANFAPFQTLDQHYSWID